MYSTHLLVIFVVNFEGLCFGYILPWDGFYFFKNVVLIYLLLAVLKWAVRPGKVGDTPL